VRALTLTVAVLTFNEAANIEACLRSAAFADQLLVIDGGSTDGTADLARALGAEVRVYPDWQGFAVQRNHQIAHARGDYVFFLDADEVMSSAFGEELRKIVASGARGVWKIRWRIVAFGKELRHLRGGTWVERLFRRDQLHHWTGAVHEEAVLEGEPGPRHTMRTRLLHHARPTVHSSLIKLTQYAMLGAAKKAQHGHRGGVLRGLASGGAMFLRLYVLRLGFLCGGPGFLYCLFIALEGFFRYAALRYDRDGLASSGGRAAS